MRILYFHQYFATPKGAWSTRVYEMARRWVAAGHQVTVVTGRYDKSDLVTRRLVEHLDIEGIKVIVLNVDQSNRHGVPRRLFSFALIGLLSTWYALRLPADVIIASSAPLSIGLPGLAARYLRRKPFVFEVRDLWLEAILQFGILRNRFAIGMARWFERRCYRAASRIVTLSPGQRDAITATDISTPVVVVPNAADNDLAEQAAALGAPSGWITTRPVALYAGALGLVNDCAQLLRVAQLAQTRHGDPVEFVVIGDGRERPMLERMAKDLQLTNLRFLGSLPKQAVFQWLQLSSCSIFTVKNLPICDTASPNKLFDAMACGVPIIQTTGGWIHDLIEQEQCGVNVRPNDPEAMVRAILRLAEQPAERARLGGNAKRLGRSTFDREMLSARFLQMLDDVHQGREGPGHTSSRP